MMESTGVEARALHVYFSYYPLTAICRDQNTPAQDQRKVKSRTFLDQIK